MIWKIVSILIFAGCASLLSASDLEANQFFKEARQKEKKGEFRSAAKAYMEARTYADSTTLRGNSLIAAARSYRKAKLYGKEFDCLQKLILEHLSGIDFSKVVERQYAIGDLFFAGHRDVPVAWLPFILDSDRTYEIYEAALKNAPCMKNSADVRLRLARYYMDEQKPDDAIRHLREIGKLYPGTEAAKYAMLELSSLLLQLTERGDGDGVYAKQALESFDDFEATYPKSAEIPWVRQAREKVLNRNALRLHQIGKYYYNHGKPELAERYFAEVIRNYPATKTAAESELLLAKVDKEYKVTGKRLKYTHYVPEVKRGALPDEAAPIMIIPEDSRNRYLFPVRNLKISTVSDSAEKPLPDDNQFY